MKTCKKCGGTDFLGCGKCKECHRLSSEKYRTRNREKALAATQKWRKENKEKVKQYQDKYNKDHSEKQAMASRVYREKNAEKAKESTSRWRRNNYSKTLIYNQNYRSKKRSSGKLSSGLTEKIYALQKGRCACCSKPLGDDFHMDHIVPLALGGINEDSNIQLLRSRCNLQKNSKHPVDFMQQRGFLL